MKCTKPSEPLTRVRQGCTSTERCFLIRKAPESCWFPHCAKKKKPRVWTFSNLALSASRAVVLSKSGSLANSIRIIWELVRIHIFRSNSRYTEFKNAGVGAKQFVFQKPSWRFRRMLKSGNHCSKKGQFS